MPPPMLPLSCIGTDDAAYEIMLWTMVLGPAIILYFMGLCALSVHIASAMLLLFFISAGSLIWFAGLPSPTECEPADPWFYRGMWVFCCIFGFAYYLSRQKDLLTRLQIIEGDLCQEVVRRRWKWVRWKWVKSVKQNDGLCSRLMDGSIRLLRVEWLLKQSPDYVIQCRQQLELREDDVFWPPQDAVRLLHAGRVAALSYKWLGKGAPDDESAFHTKAVRSFLQKPALRRRPFTPLLLRHRGHIAALMWDYASLYQEFWDEPNIPDLRDELHGRETWEQYQSFQLGLSVMGFIYASPRVLVIQHRRLPQPILPTSRSPAPLLPPYAPKPPPPTVQRESRIPYELSGWCQFESQVSSLVTVAGGHAVDLGVGRVHAHAGQHTRTVEEMQRFFADENIVKFQGAADRDVVARMYADLRDRVDAFDATYHWKVGLGYSYSHLRHRLLMHTDSRSRRYTGMLLLLVAGGGWLCFVIALIYSAVTGVPLDIHDELVIQLLVGWISYGVGLPVCFFFVLVHMFLSSPLVRPHVKAALPLQSLHAAARDEALPSYTFHWSWWSAPPLRVASGDRDSSPELLSQTQNTHRTYVHSSTSIVV